MKSEEVTLMETERMGNSRLDGWGNRLYFGDNWGILTHLLADKDVCGKVNLKEGEKK